MLRSCIYLKPKQKESSLPREMISQDIQFQKLNPIIFSDIWKNEKNTDDKGKTYSMKRNTDVRGKPITLCT